MKCRKWNAFNKVSFVTHPGKIIFVGWLILVFLEKRVENGLYLQCYTWNRQRRMKNGIFRQMWGTSG